MSAQQAVRMDLRLLPDGTQEWDWVCPHGTSSTEEVRNHFSRDQILGAWVHESKRFPNASDGVVQLAAIRLLLNLLSAERLGCDCDPLPTGPALGSNGAH